MGIASIRLLLLGSAVFVWAGCATAHSLPVSSGNAALTRVSGTVETSLDGAHWRNAHPGDIISQDGWLRTRADGHVAVRLDPFGGVLTLMPGSVLQFAQLGRKEADSEIVATLDLRQGRVVGDTLALPPHAKILVRTPEGAYDIR